MEFLPNLLQCLQAFPEGPRPPVERVQLGRADGGPAKHAADLTGSCSTGLRGRNLWKRTSVHAHAHPRHLTRPARARRLTSKRNRRIGQIRLPADLADFAKLTPLPESYETFEELTHSSSRTWRRLESLTTRPRCWRPESGFPRARRTRFSAPQRSGRRSHHEPHQPIDTPENGHIRPGAPKQESPLTTGF